jgi:hypothetical protein
MQSSSTNGATLSDVKSPRGVNFMFDPCESLSSSIFEQRSRAASFLFDCSLIAQSDCIILLFLLLRPCSSLIGVISVLYLERSTSELSALLRAH